MRLTLGWGLPLDAQVEACVRAVRQRDFTWEADAQVLRAGPSFVVPLLSFLCQSRSRSINWQEKGECSRRPARCLLS